MATIARYACAYEAIAKPDWWDKSKRLACCSLPPRVTLTKSVLAPSSNKALTSAIFPAISVERLVNPYVQPVLYVRRPGDELEQAFRFPDDDPFFSEVSNLIDIIEDIEEDPEAAQILSTYDDAVRTYELTWAIRQAAERSRAAKLQASAEAAKAEKPEA
ncbi:hypothetical protein C0993_011552 [Termitomyces sp. T159_Od127]|nr:hypothetical protein C0993_011552 [Termitomyces sp. T159_Od127]